MAKSSKLRVSTIYTPGLVFTPAVTKADLSKLHHKPTRFGTGVVKTIMYMEEEIQSTWTRRADATLVPDPNERWSYHQTLEIYRGNHCIDRGVCIRATWDKEKSLALRWTDFSWELDLVKIRYCATLNMKGAEQAYWMIRLMHSGKNPHVLGYVPDTAQRVFRYAVPLVGMSNNDAGQLIGHSDFGITSSDGADPVNKLIEKLTKDVDKESWAVDVPKIYGTVVAHTLLEAEAHALRRARFAADLITFALQAGASHFDTAHDSERLDWNAAESMTTVSTRPWLLLYEDKTLKGWVRSVPLTFADKKAELRTAQVRLRTFFRHFKEVAKSGDVVEQLRSSAQSVRENRIAKAVQTAVHWLAEAARTPEDEYRLLPVWTALEAMLCAMEYPPIFDEHRVNIKKVLLAAIDAVGADENETDKAGVLTNLLKGRLLDNAWPIRTRLELFAKAFAVTLRDGDTEVVRRLSRMRGQAVHTGSDRSDGLGCEIAQLKYLVERMIMAASVCGVRTSTGDKKHLVKIVGIEPGNTGAATIYIDGEEVPYTLSVKRRSDGSEEMVILSDGRIYDESNSVIT